MTDIHPLHDTPFVFLYSIPYTFFVVSVVMIGVFFLVFGVLVRYALFGNLQQLRVYLTSRETYKKRFLEKYTFLQQKKQEFDTLDRQQFYTDMTFLWRSILYAKTEKKIVFSLTFTEIQKHFPTEYKDILEQLRESYF